MEKNNTKNNLLISFIIALIGSLLIVANIFLPFVSATEDFGAVLEKAGDEVVNTVTDMTAEDAISVSLMEYSDAFAREDSEVTLDMVLLIAFALFGVLAVIFTFIKKPIPVIIFSILSFIPYYLFNFDVNDRNILESSTYETSIAYYLIPIAIVIAIGGAIFMFIVKRKAKNAA